MSHIDKKSQLLHVMAYYQTGESTSNENPVIYQFIDIWPWMTRPHWGNQFCKWCHNNDNLFACLSVTVHSLWWLGSLKICRTWCPCGWLSLLLSTTTANHMFTWLLFKNEIGGVVKEYGDSSAAVQELPQSCTKPTIYAFRRVPLNFECGPC